ncbi:MAG: fasciclin domain-containing protein [Chitinophagaceae bacterium]|nr:fasciclin domain-containing protein [Chitinophagaceae bacterium]MDP1763468.1 fasciclin domain-containing protein [Sediminibacterium sp.]MDP1811906.1 fasciclin domain-containing protein [Sediminibacterium sp.]MDP3128471.1 fasciclin domain-containing protein [Sediminibacterium sp.]MDP3666938.1 fasciclin domain-containing protein [Sediminibacterium sp.]
MKKLFIVFAGCCCGFLQSCENNPETNSGAATVSTEITSGQSGVQDDVSQKNVVQVASGSKDHTTLVAAVKAAELVDALSNAGPFTVFAPTNAAFDKLPAGTVDGLLKPEKKDDLIDILQYHVSVGVYKAEALRDGQSLGQVNGSNITVSMKDGKILLNGNATIIASIPASNGIIHVIDGVLLPPPPKK